MNDYEDPDWEAEAKAGEAEEKKRELWMRVVEYQSKARRIEQPLSIKRLKPGTRLIVTFFEEDEDPSALGPMEFTILDSESCKVLVKDRHNFIEPTEGTLLGCEHFTCEQIATPPFKRIFQEGTLERFWWLNFDVGGKRFDRDTIRPTLKDIKIILPSGKAYDLWKIDD